ncbi:MAG: sulfur reduction protein DsrJ [Alphaproteobacteria bacterium]
MNTVRGIFAALLLALTAVTVTPAGASASEDGVPLPSPSKAFKGEQCVEPTDIMRREHMVYLQHQRDETLRDGIRGKKYSLNDCVACHATVDPNIADGKVRTVQPFCAECHKYAAVKIDCFACHTGKVEKDKVGALIPNGKAKAADDLVRLVQTHANAPGGTGSAGGTGSTGGKGAKQ